ncbi:hypothetical protein CERSUDRAFT_43065, partial [Gelatoporia subvermispora B]
MSLNILQRNASNSCRAQERGKTATDSTQCQCPPHSGRNLVVCIDGVFNYWRLQPTNVYTLYHLAKTSSGDNSELTYYDDGTGSPFEPLADNSSTRNSRMPSRQSVRSIAQVFSQRVDIAIAWNFKDTVLRAYRWLSDKYQEGDRIFFFGFSRGAYQVRALAAMIHMVGLICKGNEERIPRSIIDAASAQAEVTKTETAAKQFKESYSRNVRVHFVGAWDTTDWGLIHRLEAPHVADGMNHVCFFRHALALDERRVTFLPKYADQWLSNTNDDSKDAPTWHDTIQDGDQTHTKEVWFAGTHHDMSMLGSRAPALRWMMYEASREGLQLNEWTVHHDGLTEVHESLTGMWWYLEFLPMKHLSYGSNHWPHLGAARSVIEGQKIHDSVLV